MSILSIFQNKLILIPLIAGIIAQLIKITLILIKKGKIKFKEAIWSVGMPSSHAAFFSALVVSVGLKEGIKSSLFAIVLIFSLAYLSDLMLIFKVVKERVKKVKGSIGHSFSEILVGVVIGVVIAFLLM